jgi:hypothetical protein
MFIDVPSSFRAAASRLDLNRLPHLAGFQSDTVLEGAGMAKL